MTIDFMSIQANQTFTITDHYGKQTYTATEDAQIDTLSASGTGAKVACIDASGEEIYHLGNIDDAVRIAA